MVRRRSLFGIILGAFAPAPKPYSIVGKASAYGPETYRTGNTTAAGLSFDFVAGPKLIGIAHRWLPKGITVAVDIPPQQDAWGKGLREHGALVWTKVVDRGPYVAGREFDLTVGLLRHIGFFDPGWTNFFGPNSEEEAALEWGIKRTIKVHVFP